MKQHRIARSEVTGKMEMATVCPTLISEIDDKVIVDGTPDIDLLMLFPLAVENGQMMPAPLAENGRLVHNKNQRKILKAWARDRKNKTNAKDRETALQSHATRIAANESGWNEVPEEIDDDLYQAAMRVMVAALGE